LAVWNVLDNFGKEHLAQNLMCMKVKELRAGKH